MFSQSVTIGKIPIGRAHPIRVMGIINVSPESFYGSSVVTDSEAIIERARQMEQDGADILDIGAASTAPASLYGTKVVDEEEETSRIRTAIESLASEVRTPLSVDTTSSRVARVALSSGAAAVNDVSGLKRDPNLAHLVKEYDVPIILMAGCEPTFRGFQDTLRALREGLARATEAGIERNKIVIDPGFGFGKPTSADIEILENLGAFTLLRQPVLVGLSRKAFVGAILGGLSPDDRLAGTIAVTTLAVSKGVDVIRVHDVKESKQTAVIGDIFRSKQYKSSGFVESIGQRDRMETEVLLQEIGVSPEIRSALSRKAYSVNIIVNSVKPPVALILKQEMLAVGGDAAYHYDTIDQNIEHTDVLLMGTLRQFGLFVSKASKMKEFGLSEIAGMIRDVLTGQIHSER
ncbi:MAG: dihydropteroate synthase [Candidatus Thorarchaeota archaeon]|nr:dihydropteroate synthase [Candidatus Thorarchaeota archaeon]